MKGFALVGTDENPDFVMVGGLTGPIKDDLRNTPVLLLSGNCMYSDRDYEFGVRDKKPMSEDDPIFLPSTLEPAVVSTLNYLTAETQLLQRKHTMVLRIFNVYGPDINHGLIYDSIKHMEEGYAIPVYQPGYHTRTFLHQTDFLEVFEQMVQRFLDGSTGIFNIGSDEEISTKRLADSIWQLRKGVDVPVDVEMRRAPRSYRWWVLPDLTRTKALARWKPRVSLRTGLWEMLCLNLRQNT